MCCLIHHKKTRGNRNHKKHKSHKTGEENPKVLFGAIELQTANGFSP